MLEFLNHYPRATNLDNARFDHLFAPEVSRSDFLLFDESTICEYKEIINFSISDRIEHLAKKAPNNNRNFKRDFYNSINNALSWANKQIRETKVALGTPDALGLIIIENKIPEHLSVLALMDAAERKMINGLECVDAVLCLDLVNTFINRSGSLMRPAQTLTRDSERSDKLSNLVGELLRDYCSLSNTPFHNDFGITKGDQTWVTGPDGRYKKFVGTLQMQDNPSDVSQDL